MTGVHELLDRLKQLGATLSAEGDRLIVRAGSQAVPAELITEIRRAKAEVLESIPPTKLRRSSGSNGFWSLRAIGVREIETLIAPRSWHGKT